MFYSGLRPGGGCDMFLEILSPVQMWTALSETTNNQKRWQQQELHTPSLTIFQTQTYKIYTHTQSTKGLKFNSIWFRTYLQSTPYNTNPNNLNLSLTRNNFHFPSDRFYIILPSITRTPKNSNLFLLPLKVRISGSRPYIVYFKRK